MRIIANGYSRYESEPEGEFAGYGYKPRGYEKGYLLHEPEVVQVLVFLSRGGILGDRKIRGKSTVSKYLKKDVEFVQEGNNLFIFQRSAITSEEFDNDEGPWTEISMRNIDQAVKDIQKAGENRRAKLEKKLKEHQYIGALSFIIAGSKRNYWVEPEVDLTSVLGDEAARESFFKGISSTLKLDMLNQSTFGAEDIYGSSIDTFPFNVNLYAFRSMDKKVKGNTTSPPTQLLLDYDVEEDPSDSVMDGPGGFVTPEPQSFSFGDSTQEEKEPKSSSDSKGFHYKKQIDILLKTITRFMAYHLTFGHLNRENFEKYKKNAARIRKDIQVLQGGINTLLIEDESGKKKNISLSKSGKKGGSSLTEDDIIYRSSVYSSNLCEIDENVSNLILFLNDRAGIIERMESESQFERLEEGDFADILSPLSDELKEWRDAILTSINKLARNLANSQNRLNNTIDVFKTYRESKRRREQKRTTLVLNVIFAVFATFELADCLGCFIIFGLEPENHWTTAVELLLLDFAILAGIFLIIYVFVLRKIWRAE